MADLNVQGFRRAPSSSDGTFGPLSVQGTDGGNLPVSGTVVATPSGTQAASVADGADVTQGAQADAAWSGSGSGTLVSILKAIWTRLRGGQATMANSLPVTVASDQSNVGVDTELPAAAAMADDMANPTTPSVAALAGLYDGATWDRIRSATAAAGTTGTGVLAAGAMTYDGTNFTRWRQATNALAYASGGVPYVAPGIFDNANSQWNVVALPLDGATGTVVWPSGQMVYNGTTWDRKRGNFDTTTGDTGAKVATFNGATQINYNARGAYITIKLGTVSGTTPTLAAQFQMSYDGGTTFQNVGPALANLTATGQTGLITIYPTNISQAAGVTPANLTSGATQTMALNTPLPRVWRLMYTIGGTTPSFAITAVYVNYIL